MVIASLFFYGWWDIKYVPLIIVSILFNFSIGTYIERQYSFRKIALIFGILINVALLGFFKYCDFFISNINYVTEANLNLLRIVLPLGISFFTFTQIAYLVDVYNNDVKEYDLLNYSLFVTFFPHLLAGPIIHHKEMMPQFINIRNKVINYRNISIGTFLFSIGLCKKIIIADTFAIWANSGYDMQAHVLPLFDAWRTSLSYTFQIYFDFSGYTDMALGSALIFNIALPFNFNSPYKSLDIQDFWRRWHITLSRFLRDYIYIPLGGNRRSEFRTLSNLMTTFLVGGLWHGAGWTFVFWGFLHGLAIVIHRLWKKLNFRMPRALAWFITFNFVNVTWIFFRAKNWDEALKVLKGLVNFNGIGASLSSTFRGKYSLLSFLFFIILNLITISILLFFKNSNEMANNFKLDWRYGICISFMMSLSLVLLAKKSEFLYFQF